MKRKFLILAVMIVTLSLVFGGCVVIGDDDVPTIFGQGLTGFWFLTASDADTLEITNDIKDGVDIEEIRLAQVTEQPSSWAAYSNRLLANLEYGITNTDLTVDISEDHNYWIKIVDSNGDYLIGGFTADSANPNGWGLTVHQDK